MLRVLLAAAIQLAGTRENPCHSALEAFRAALEACRAGDASARELLLDQSKYLTESCGRPECALVAGYYLDFDDEELARGLAIEARLREVRAAYNAAVVAETDAEGWRAVRARLIAETEAIAADGAREPEWLSGLRATSFAARLRVETLELQPGLATHERDEIARRALAEAETAADGFERTGQIGASLEPRWLVGRLARLAGDRSRARDCFLRCLADAGHLHVPAFEEHALRGLLGLARDTGDLIAEEHALAGLARVRPNGDSWKLSRDWAAHLLSTDQPRLALEYLERHAPPERRADERRDWHMVAGAAALLADEVDLARAHVEQAVLGRQDAVAVIALARVDLASGDPAAAAERIETSIDPFELDPLAEAHVRALLGEAALASGNLDRARDELVQALAGARGWEAFLERDPLAGESPTAVRNVFGEWLGVHTIALFAWTLALRGDSLEAARVVEEYQSRALRRGGAPGNELRALAGLDPAELSREDLRAWAASHGAGLVTWAIGPEFGVAVRVDSRGNACAARIDAGRAWIADQVRRFDEALVAGDDGWSGALARELARVLFPGAIAQALAREPDDSSLLCLPHGVLEALPLERLEVGGRPLEERFLISVLPGIVAPRPRGARGIAEWTFLGAPSGSGAGPLPSARSELETLAQRTRAGGLALGGDCTREALLDALARGGGLHVATHALRAGAEIAGRFAPVGLEVAGGDVVTAEEIRRHAGPLELVVLSSCASAEGRLLEAEGLHGIARAFLEAGARDVVATLRPVGDAAAREFALAFHERIAAGETRAAAVRAARRDLARADHPLADWTAFRLLGQD